MRFSGKDTGKRNYAAEEQCEARRRTPLTLNGPVTSSRPEGSCFRKMTRLPLKRPASRMSTVPGLMLERSRAGRATVRRFSGFFTSSAG